MVRERNIFLLSKIYSTLFCGARRFFALALDEIFAFLEDKFLLLP
jgi:hypothetical protein